MVPEYLRLCLWKVVRNFDPFQNASVVDPRVKEISRAEEQTAKVDTPPKRQMVGCLYEYNLGFHNTTF